MTSSEATVVSNFYGISLKVVPSFQRIKLQNTNYYSLEYTRVKLRNSYTILYSESFYGQILFFILHNNQPAIVLRKLKKLPDRDSYTPSQFIPVKITEELEVISPKNVNEKLIFIDTVNTFCYALKFPCTLNID